MKKFAILGGMLLFIVGCATNPFSGKKTLALQSDSELFPMSFQQYDDFLKDNKVIAGTDDAKRVAQVGARIKDAAQKWLTNNGYPNYLKDYQWEYHLVDSPEINAWCMPGGKIVVYVGILAVTKDDAGLATVMGHEVSHALANHGQQRMSYAMLQQVGATGIGLLTSNSSPVAQQIWGAAYGYGTEIGGMLPFSRANESEADKIGLTLMAIAGYNPSSSIEFWKRMAAATNGAETNPFLSTHPSNAQRIADLEMLVPQAKADAAKYGVHF